MNLITLEVLKAGLTGGVSHMSNIPFEFDDEDDIDWRDFI